jgi:hypothetical protein
MFSTAYEHPDDSQWGQLDDLARFKSFCFFARAELLKEMPKEQRERCSRFCVTMAVGAPDVW